MIKYITIFLLPAYLVAGVTIRPINLTDVPSALALDEAICAEYFKPMFIEQYQDTIIGKDPDYCLALDIANDRQLFPDCAQSVGKEKMVVAVDEQGKVIGLIVVHQEDEDTAEVDLLLVDLMYRGQGIGTLLMQSALAMFNVKQHGVYVFSRNYKALNFYIKHDFVITGPGPQNRQTVYGPSFAELYVYCKRVVA